MVGDVKLLQKIVFTNWVTLSLMLYKTEWNFVLEIISSAIVALPTNGSV